MAQYDRLVEVDTNPKALQDAAISLVSDNSGTNYLGLDTRKIDNSYSGWFRNTRLGNLILGISKDRKKTPVQYTAFSKATTWINSDTSRRTAIKRKAYEALSKLTLDDIIDLENINDEDDRVNQFSVRDLLTRLSTNKIEKFRAQYANSNNDTINTLLAELDEEDSRVFNEFQRTLIDAEPNGMVGTFVQGRRNPHLAHILSMFTLLYANSPEKNPLLHDAKSQENPTDFLRGLVDDETLVSVIDRAAVNEYMKKIRKEIKKLIEMPPAAFDMAFSEDDQKQQTIVQVLKRAFNRLSAEIDYKYRFKNEHKAFGLEICNGDVAIVKPNEIVYNDESFSYVVYENGNLHVRNFPHNLTVIPKDHKDYPKFKDALLKKAAENGFEYHEKSNDYVKAKTQRKTGEDHKKLASKLSMHNLKKTFFRIAFVAAVILTAGQVAIAVFAAVGSMAIAIGLACAVTNILLFWRDFTGVLIALFRGDLFYGMSGRLITALSVYFSFCVAAGIVNGGFAFSALISAFGFTFATAPFAVMLGAGIISAVTVLGMMSMFFMPGVGFAKGLRGKTLGQVCSESWASLKGFFSSPKFNHDLIKLQYEVKRLMKSNGKGVFDYEVHKEISLKRNKIALLKFEHYARHFLKCAFALVLVPAALIGTFILAFAVSKASVEGTANLIQLALKWSNAAASLAAAGLLSWVPGFAVNFVLTSKNLTNFSLLIGAKVAQVTTGVVYGVAMFGAMMISGMFFATITEAAKVYWNYPSKEVLLPVGRIILGLGVLALVFLNGYGNGGTLGQQGAFSLDWLPTRVLSWLEKMAPTTIETLKANFGVITTVVGNASSDALNAGAVREFSQNYSLLSAPVMRLDSGEKRSHDHMVTKLEGKNTHGITFFERKCAQYDHNVRGQLDSDNYNPLTELEVKFQD